MAKAQPKKRSPVVYLGALAALVAAYLVLNPGGDPVKSTTRPKSAAKKKTDGTTFTQADYAATTASFKPQTGGVTNAFKPLILRNTGGIGGPGSAIPGQAGWGYSGMYVIDGVKHAILENSTTNDNKTLTKGERWGEYRCANIYPDHIDLDGPDGPLTVAMQIKETGNNTPTAPVNNAAPPVTVPLPSNLAAQLQGTIGNQDLSVQADDTSGGRRRRRRNGN
jgi:hypothetical protein